MGSRIMLAAMSPALLLGAATNSANGQHAATPRCNSGNSDNFELRSTIAFTSTRDDPHAEIYLLNPDGTDPRRLTTNAVGDAFPSLSPDGKKIVFDSNRNFPDLPVNMSDLFMMNADGTDETFLVRGASATWSPDCKNIAFHASASGTGTPIRNNPGSATTDSDVFVANVDDLRAGVEQPTNITNSADKIDDDADWSPDGRTIIYSAFDVDDNPALPNSAEIYRINSDGTGRQQLTDNDQEERAPAWSPNGARIAYMCRKGPASRFFEICVMNADGTNELRLTVNNVFEGTPTWAPDGTQILLARNIPATGAQLFVIDAECPDHEPNECETQLTFAPDPNTPVQNFLAKWGQIRVHLTP